MVPLQKYGIKWYSLDYCFSSNTVLDNVSLYMTSNVRVLSWKTGGNF